MLCSRGGDTMMARDWCLEGAASERGAGIQDRPQRDALGQAEVEAGRMSQPLVAVFHNPAAFINHS
jgi:hypothetical protein